MIPLPMSLVGALCASASGLIGKMFEPLVLSPAKDRITCKRIIGLLNFLNMTKHTRFPHKVTLSGSKNISAFSGYPGSLIHILLNYFNFPLKVSRLLGLLERGLIYLRILSTAQYKWMKRTNHAVPGTSINVVISVNR